MAAGNSVMDEIREQHKKMKGKSLKEKFQYFWEYYRVATLVTILVAVFLGNLIYTVATAKDNALYAVFVNGYTDMDTEEYMAGFDEYAQIDTKNYSTTLETNFTLGFGRYLCGGESPEICRSGCRPGGGCDDCGSGYF